MLQSFKIATLETFSKNGIGFVRQAIPNLLKFSPKAEYSSFHRDLYRWLSGRRSQSLKRFLEADTNGDGKLSGREFQAARQLAQATAERAIPRFDPGWSLQKSGSRLISKALGFGHRPQAILFPQVRSGCHSHSHQKVSKQTLSPHGRF